jgi:hypothetical protein
MYIARYGVVKNDYLTFTLIFNNNEEKRIANGSCFVSAEASPSIERCSKD